MNLLKTFDLYGSQFNFSSFGTSTFNTRVGGFFSILLALSTVAISVIFAQDMLNRTNPYIISRIISSNDTEYMTINKELFPIAFRFENGVTAQAIENKAFKIEATYFNNDIKTNVDVVNCEKMKVKNISLLDEISNSTGWKCLNLTSETNSIGGIDRYLYINFRILKNSTDLLSKESASARVALPIHIFFPEDTIEPFHQKHQSYYRNVGKNLRKFVDYYFTKPKLKDDQGIIFETESNFEILTLDIFNFDSIFNDGTSEDGDKLTIGTFSFYYKTEHLQYIRKFDKIQDVIANIGGFMQIIYFCLWVFLYPYTEYKMNSKFINSYFSFNPVDECILIKNQMLKTKKSLYGRLKKNFILAKKIAGHIDQVNCGENSAIPDRSTSGNKRRLPMLNLNLNGESIEPTINGEQRSKDLRCKSQEVEIPNDHLGKVTVETPISVYMKNNKGSKLSVSNNARQVEVQYKHSEPKTSNSRQHNQIYDVKSSGTKYPFNDIPFTNLTKNLGKFDYFYSNLEYFAQKKKSGFMLNIPPHLDKEIDEYMIKHYEKQEKFHVSFCRYIASNLFCFKSNKLFTLTNEIIGQKLDISNYLKLMINVEKLKKISLNYYQGLSLNFQAKPNVFDEDLSGEFSEQNTQNLVEVLSYFMNRDSNAQMDNVDYLCLQDFEQPFKDLIFDKCEDIKNFYKDTY